MRTPSKKRTAALNEAAAHRKWMAAIRIGCAEKREIAFAEFVAAMMRRRETDASMRTVIS
jgi:hypothetical protein